jgi:aldose 1-epimerase
MVSQITKELFGTTDDGQEVYKFVIENKNGLALEVISYSAIIVGIKCPDKYVVNVYMYILT